MADQASDIQQRAYEIAYAWAMPDDAALDGATAAIAAALLSERTRAKEEQRAADAKIAARDVDWTRFRRSPKPAWKSGDETNIYAPPRDPDDTMPTDANVFAYKMGIAAGAAIAAAILSSAPQADCCPICGGDCASANPPVACCPMRPAAIRQGT